MGLFGIKILFFAANLMLSCVAQPRSSKYVFEQLLDERGLPFRINVMKTRQQLETERLLWSPVFGRLLTPGHRPVCWYLRRILKTSGFFSVDSYTCFTANLAGIQRELLRKSCKVYEYNPANPEICI
jgi:hypothetical protein